MIIKAVIGLKGLIEKDYFNEILLASYIKELSYEINDW
jgi:hypothetical protein